ncbi:MAG: ATP-dependent metallopeptidase FtsH/Yme1/Tma family protein, partial [Lachnospiraceae bacterium]
MNKRFRGGIIYLVIMLVIMYFIISYSSLGKDSSSYGYSDFIADIAADNVASVEVTPNSEVPTGMVKVLLKDSNTSFRFYVTDVNEVTQLAVASDSNIRLVVNDVVRESIFLTTILPFLLIAAVMVMITLIISRQAAGAGGSANTKMMNFGKSRARMTDPNSPGRVTFKDVAGLAEEKEELEEIVDFLKYPKKYV